MPNVFSPVANMTNGPILRGIDVTDVIVFVESFADLYGLPVNFFKGRAFVEDLTTVRTYSEDGLTYTDTPYVDSSYIDNEFALALTPTPGGVFQWTQEAPNGYGNDNNEITYYGITQSGEITIPPAAGECFGIHRATDTNNVWVGFTSAFFTYHGIDVTDTNSILINMHNQKLCLGMSGQKIEGGSEVWNRQAIVVSNGDQNKAEPQYKDMEGVPVDNIADARHGHYSVGGGKMLGDSIAKRGHISLLDAGDVSIGDAPMDENIGTVGDADGVADQVEFISDLDSDVFWVLMTVGGGSFPQLKVFQVFGYSMDTPGSDEYLSTFDDSAEALGSKINRNTTNVAELDNRVGDLESDSNNDLQTEVDSNSTAIESLEEYTMKRLENTGTTDSYKQWLGENRPVQGFGNIQLSHEHMTGDYVDIVSDGSIGKLRLYSGLSGGIAAFIGTKDYSRFDVWQNSAQQFTVDNQGINCRGNPITNTPSFDLNSDYTETVKLIDQTDFYIRELTLSNEGLTQ